jgi:hypothetical protein
MSPPREPSSTGLDAHVAASLAYLAGPLSGILVLLAERTNTYVRFHAWQSILGLGGLGLIVAGLLALAFLSVLVSATVRVLLEAGARAPGSVAGTPAVADVLREFGATGPV